MATTVIAYNNQSMWDLILQSCGSMEAGMQFCLDNNVGITSIPVVGQSYIVSDAALALGDSGAVLQMQQNGVLVATLAAAYEPPVPDGAILSDGGNVIEGDNGNVVLADN